MIPISTVEDFRYATHMLQTASNFTNLPNKISAERFLRRNDVGFGKYADDVFRHVESARVKLPNHQKYNPHNLYREMAIAMADLNTIFYSRIAKQNNYDLCKQRADVCKYLADLAVSNDESYVHDTPMENIATPYIALQISLRKMASFGEDEFAQQLKEFIDLCCPELRDPMHAEYSMPLDRVIPEFLGDHTYQEIDTRELYIGKGWELNIYNYRYHYTDS